MLFAIDVGNTNITIGLFDGENLVKTFRMTTGISRTSDEFGVFLSDLLRMRNLTVDAVDEVIIASVVPNVMHSLTNGIKKYFKINPLIVEPGVKTGINVAIPNPKQLGADRLVDAVAGYYIYGGPVLVIDFGTATTYDLVNAEGSFVGGVTSPGIRLSANALWSGTAKLPEIEIKVPDTVLCKDTISSMQAGVCLGYIGQTEYIVKRMKKETGLNNMKVVATGGLGKMIYENTDCIDVYDPDLTLHGLRLIMEKQK
jgi:type III pantothenate kinase